MLVPVEVPTGPRVLELLPRLRAALDGTGPGLLPFATGDTAPPAPRTDDSIALAVSTSGSTGSPKQVLLSAAALRHSGGAGQRRLHDGDPGTWLLTLPAQHIAGLNVLIRAALAGREPVVLDIARTFTAAAFVAASDTLPSGPAFVSLVPTQLHRLLGDPEGTAALRRFTAVLVGGAATGPDLITAATGAGVAIVTSYGMSETAGGCVYDGRPLDGVRVELADSRIVLSGPVVADGYAVPGVAPDGRTDPPHRDPSDRSPSNRSPFDRSPSNRDPFDRSPSNRDPFDRDPFDRDPFDRDPRTGERRFTTADLGVLTGDGVLTVLGRADDVLISGGVNVAPLAVEHALAAAPGVAQVAVTGIPDPEWGTRLVAVVVPDTDDGPVLETLRALATAAVGPAAAPRHLVLIDALPTRGPGKLDRQAVAAYALHALQPPTAAR